MRKPFRIMSVTATTTAMALTFAGLIGLSTASVYAEDKKKLTPLETGKKLAFDKKKGNCLACHLIIGGDQAGNIAPPLIGMKGRFPDKAVLRAQIYDARVKVPNTIMIPFGPHGVLSEKELDLVLDFIYTL